LSPDSRKAGVLDAIEDVTEKVTILVREEIDLAKAEITEKIKKLLRGVVIGIACGVFLVLSLIYLGHAASWGIWQITGLETNYWVGFAAVALILLILGAVAGLLSARLFKSSGPPTPDLAIEEAGLIAQTLTSHGEEIVEEVKEAADALSSPEGPTETGESGPFTEGKK
jgi:uncharacterized membrane protein YqjE